MNELFEEFQEFRKILCICPCCGELTRVSDLHLKVKGPLTRTWLDDYEKISAELSGKEEKFDEMESKIRELAVEKGRKEAEKLVTAAMHPAFKKLKLDPFDLKPILNPIDFIAFNGMTKKEEVSDIAILSIETKNEMLNKARSQIQKAIASKNYVWQLARVDEAGKITLE